MDLVNITKECAVRAMCVVVELYESRGFKLLFRNKSSTVVLLHLSAIIIRLRILRNLVFQ